MHLCVIKSRKLQTCRLCGRHAYFRNWRRLFLFLAIIIAIVLILKSKHGQERPSSSYNQIYPNDFVSKILISRAKPKSKSQTDYTSNLRFGHENWIDGYPLLVGPTPYQPERKRSVEVQEFLSRQNLILTPFDTDALSPYLTTTREVIREAQRVHLNLFTDLFRGKKYAVLFHLAIHENKGDSAIGVGELMMLERMGIKMLTYLDTDHNEDKDYAHALTLAQRYPRDEVVVLLHGGGNIFGYHNIDVWREKALRHFRLYSVILFAQSIYMASDKGNFQFAMNLYCCDPRLTIVLRDRLSLQIAQRLFNNGTRLLLAPDMAFQLGPLTRHAPPFYDVSWQRRPDREQPNYSENPEDLFPANITLWTWQWLTVKSLSSPNSLIQSSNVMQNGLGLLQRGRVVVTDRLHGHILCTLLDIPHVLLDNAHNKLSSYHNTWTRGLANCRLASTVKEAARFALELLEVFKDVLPRRITAVDIPSWKQQ